MEPLDGLGDPDLRATLLYVRRQAEPPTAADAAAALDVPPSVARWRLERLVEAGLLEPVYARRNGLTGPGAGRPAKTYAVVAEREAIEFPRRRYEELLRLLIEALPARGRDTKLGHVGRAFGRELARAARFRPAARAEIAFQRICAGLGELGFQASVESVSDDGAVIVTPTCPLRPLVGDELAAREIDRGMWRGLVEEALFGADAVDIRCETHDCLAPDSSCRISIGLNR